MIRVNRIATILTMALALGGCNDAFAPTGADVTVPGVNAGKGKPSGGGDNTAGPETHVLRQDPNAPMLEAYTASFWAVKGQDRTLEIWYQDYTEGIESYGSFKQSNRFFQFLVPRGALDKSPLGISYETGDSVLISVTVHPDNFDIEFQPSGLTFTKRHPAELKIWYGLADHDLNGDGTFDAADQDLLNQLSIFHHEGPLSAWDKIGSKNDTVEMSVKADVKHFSGYAVSW